MPAPTRAHHVTIDGFPIPCLAVECASLLPLWPNPSRRGSDVTIPHRAGDRSRPRRVAGTKKQLELVISGLFDMDDDPAVDPRATLEANLAYFRLNVSDPTNVGDGTRTAVLHLPSAATATGPITVEDLDLAELGPVDVRAVLVLKLPEGALA